MLRWLFLFGIVEEKEMISMSRKKINLYIDESAHLLNDESNTMVIGTMYIPIDFVKKSQNDIKKIKLANGFSTNYEIKWTRVTKAHLQLAKDLVNYFFDQEALRFRSYIIDKTCLDHESFGQDHDTWYYKMMYKMIEYIQEQGYDMNIYLDVKDTRSKDKMNELYRILNYHSVNFNYGNIKKVQVIDSCESQIMQLTDLFIGALRYAKEDINTSASKIELVDLIKKRAGKSLNTNSTLSNFKFNIFHWSMNVRKGGM